MAMLGPLIIHVGALAAALALGACAGSGAVMDDFDPAEVRVITPTEATSKCIGDPRTPACALDTMFACVVRRDAELCRRVGIDETFAREPCFKPGILDARYKIKEIELLAEKDMPPYLKKKKREGELYAVIVYNALLCRPHRLPCTTFNIGGAETLKSSGQGWVVTWFPWQAVQCEPDDDEKDGDY